MAINHLPFLNLINVPLDTHVTVDRLLDLLAGLVRGRVEERAKGLDALRHLCRHGANLPRLLI